MHRWSIVRVAVLLLVCWAGGAAAADPMADGLKGLSQSSLRAKAEAAAQIADSGAPGAVRVLRGLLEGRLFVRRDDGRVVETTESSAGVQLFDPESGASLGPANAAGLKRIIIDNRMRVQLRTAIAKLSLSAEEAGVRREAVESLLGNLTPETLEMLREAQPREVDDDVRQAMIEAIAVADLLAPDPAQRFAAIAAVSGSMRSEVRNRLAALVDSDEDSEVRRAATAAIRDIDERRSWFGLIETAFFGLSLGFVLVLAAAGLAITFGVMGVINMAHGEMMMLGAYTTWVVQQMMPNAIEYSLPVAIPAAFLVGAMVGVIVERGVVRHLYGRPLETLLATFGVSLILQQAVRSIFSPLNRSVLTPEWMSGQLVINDALAFTYNRLYIIAFALLVFFALNAMLRYTTLGLQVRAVSQNRGMARAMGVRAAWVDAATFGLGSGVAALAGVALSQITNVGPNLGQAYIVDSFMVVVFGGVGNLWGTLVAGLSLGIANKFLEPYAGAVLAKILVLIFIILFIQKWPRGLFPQRGRAAEA